METSDGENFSWNTRFCKRCGLDINISTDKYHYEPIKGIKLLIRRTFGGEYGEFTCNGCLREKKLSIILK